MSSFSSVEKIKYNQDRQDAVALNEYIIFTDERRKSKYILFKFSNNINRVLNDIKFEIQEFDEASNLIEKVIFTYNDFSANENEDFVPNAKMRVSYECKTIKATLLYARFDFIKWEAGEFSRIPYTYDEFKNRYRNTNRPENVDLKEEIKPKTKKVEATNGKKSRRNKKKQNFKMLDVSKKNKVLYPKIITTILSFAIVVGILVAVILFTRTVDVFIDNGIEYKINSENETLEVVGYDLEESNIVIPSEIDEMRVTKLADYLFEDNISLTYIRLESTRIEIGKAAFKNCVNLRTVEAEGITAIQEEAFMGCVSLTEVYLSNVRTIEEYAYKDCKNLSIVFVPNATIEKLAFEGANKISIFTYKEFDEYLFGFIFGEDNESVPDTLSCVVTSTPNISRAYFINCDSIDTIIIKNEDTQVYNGIEEDFDVIYDF